MRMSVDPVRLTAHSSLPLVVLGSELSVTVFSVALHFASICPQGLAVLLCSFWELRVITADGLSLVREWALSSPGNVSLSKVKGALWGRSI